ncbi:chain length-determining protein [uncultured Roseobacter sp.]|uniref:GumC family protein n=1 Tax=uncultured Roseobacter sp. TaxID=114847 RepID=UPI00262CEB2A|nr:chain length-determining protein [uncultured Roseobacter sp.]
MNIDLAFYWRLFLNRLPIMLAFVLVFSSLGVITALKLPETYATSASLLVEEPQIPDRMVASTVQTDANEQLDIIQQKLLTRANLIDMANEFRVFRDIGEMNPDTVFREMRAATSIKKSAGRNRATVMTISFEGRSGRVAANVVNEMVTLALAENTTLRMSRAENTLDFFQQEVRRLGEQLDQQSADIAIFKSQNAAALPEEQRYRLDRINLLQERLAQLERDRDGIETQRSELVRVYESTGQLRRAQDNRPRSSEEARLAAAKVELEQARLIYSDTHPRMTQLLTRVERLEKAVQDQIAADNTDGSGNSDGTGTTESMLYRTTLADIDTRAEIIADEITRVQGEIEELKQANAQSAANGIELAGLERDYVNIQNRYNAALNNLNAAQVSERIESTAQGQRITVIENASVPQFPSGPNRPLIAMMGAMAGMGLAAGYFVLLELLNRAIRRPAELQSKFDIIPIAVIPYMESARQKQIRRITRVTVTLGVLVIVPLALWYIDTNYIPLELVVQKGLSRLGIG